MRIDNSDSISTNMHSSNSKNSTAAAKKATTIETQNVNSMQSNSKEWSLANGKSISQLNEYDKGNMPVSERVVIDAIQRANKAISGGNRRFEFSIHEETNEIVVKVFNSDTDELIKEIPNEKILDMVAKICEMAGILVDERR